MTIAAGAVCQISVDVTSATPSVYNNVIPAGNVTSDQGLSNEGDARATLDVQPVIFPTVTKTFPIVSLVPGEDARLTIDITNESGAVPISNVTLTDSLPAGVFVTNNPSLSTSADCQGGTITANFNDTQVAVSGVTIPTNGTCTIGVNVTSNDGGRYDNVIPIGDLTADEAGQPVSNEVAAADSLFIESLTLEKRFEPEQINPGSTSRSIVIFKNFSNSDVENGAFIDNFPAEIIVNGTDAASSNFTSTCTTGTLSIAGNQNSFTYTNITIPGRADPINAPGVPGTCEIGIDVTSTTIGQSFVNNIPPGGLTGGGFFNFAEIEGTLRVGNDVFNVVKQFVEQGSTNTVRSPLEVQLVLKERAMSMLRSSR